MANIKSSIKRIRTTNEKRAINKSRKSATKTAIKNVAVAVENNSKEEAEVLLKVAVSQIDKAAVKGIYHKNNAARQKSQLRKLVNTIN